jgi:putative FmdB family regulatory protein
MPIREYVCSSCGYIFDEIVRSTDKKDYLTSTCPQCDCKAHYLPSKPAQATGDFGTVRKSNKTAPQPLNFGKKKE